MNHHNIQELFDGKVIGNLKMQRYVYETLSTLPDELAQKVTRSCWFMSSMDDAYAYAFTGNDLKNQHLIFLSDDLFNQSDQQIHFTIAHEIGHVMLGHKNSVEYKQSTEEITRQEKEADGFAHLYGFFV